MILLIDNYDSFSYNLYQMIGAIEPEITVFRNDAFRMSLIHELAPSHIVLSPGPGKPRDAGACEAVIHEFSGEIPILGVCLGHQAICEAFGGKISRARKLTHGRPSDVGLDVSSPLFRGLPRVMAGARYHSLAVEESSLPDVLRVTAKSCDGEVMAVEHRERPVYGLQFHPESIMTPDGGKVISNFINIGRR